MHAPSLCARLGYSFADESLLLTALTHPSYAKEASKPTEHNQRLEFLGDAVLSLILAEHVYQLFPDDREGVLTRNRAALAKGRRLAAVARRLDLGPHLRVSPTEEQLGARDRNSTLEDALEALVGAVYLDGGWQAARRVVPAWYGDLPSVLQSALETHNPKGALQEWVQPRLGNSALRYETTRTEGPPHARHFEVTVYVNDQPVGTGEGSSKKLAEEKAARAALNRLATKTDP